MFFALLVIPAVCELVKVAAPAAKTLRHILLEEGNVIEFTDVNASFTNSDVEELKNRGAWIIITKGSDMWDLRQGMA